MEYYKVMMNKMKIQLEDMREKNKNILNKNENLSEELKIADDKMSQNKYNLSSIKKSIIDKDQEFNRIREELTNLESFASEKDNMEKKIIDYQRQNEIYKRDLE